jgi:hypothetical protein
MQFEKLKVQADPEHKGKHPLHEHRFITTADCEFDDSNLGVESGSIIAKMTDHENQKEYAQLFAAAPELLEACWKAIEIMCKDNLHLRSAPEFAQAASILATAIAKAEGRE